MALLLDEHENHLDFHQEQQEPILNAEVATEEPGTVLNLATFPSVTEELPSTSKDFKESLKLNVKPRKIGAKLVKTRSGRIVKRKALRDVDTLDDGANNEVAESRDAFVAGSGENRGRKRKDLPTIEEEDVEKHLDDAAQLLKDGDVIHCLLCDFKTGTRQNLKSHLIRCHLPQRFKCKYCSKTYSIEKDLRAHIRAHFPHLQCRKCEKKFPTRTLRYLHEKRYHEKGDVKRRNRAERQLHRKCDHCEYIAESMTNLETHVARSHAEKLYECDICAKKFGLERDMQVHRKSHNVFVCDICGKELHSKAALKSHTDTIHLGIKKRPLKTVMCDHCGVSLASKNAYQEHVNREHLHVRPFGCPLCSMSFYSNYSLRSHINTHGEQRNFSCEECGRSFKNTNALKTHMNTHLDASLKPFMCNICSRTFAQKGALVRHHRIHTGAYEKNVGRF